MARRPDVRYAWNGDVALAYQVFGAGPVDLVYLQGYVSHVDLNWDSPYLAKFLRGLGERARVIHTDRRGWGCSDRFSPGDVAPLEVQADDLVRIMDAAGSARALVFGSYDTSLAAVLFAARYRDRCAGLVLCDPIVTYSATEATPWMQSEDSWAEELDDIHAKWGTAAWFEGYDRVADDRERKWIVSWSRASVAPGALAAEVRAFYRVDVRSVLPSIQVPTLVVGRPDVRAGGQNARFIAARITGSRLIEPDGDGGVARFHWYARGPAILAATGDLIASIREKQ